MRTIRLQVTLREVTPAVLRVVDVPASCMLSELHDLLQVALGWTDSHLHQFLAGDACYGVPDRSATDQLDEAGMRLPICPSGLSTSTTSVTGGLTTSRSLDPGSHSRAVCTAKAPARRRTAAAPRLRRT